MSSRDDRGADEADHARWELFTELLLQAVNAARVHVGLDEATFRTHTFHSFPREFFLWTALDEVQKTAIFLMKLDDFLDGQDLPRVRADEADPTERAIEAILLEEEGLRARRQCELLVQLVLFLQKDDVPIYSHFLLLEDLVRAAAYNDELEEFHGAPSDWVNATMEMTLARIWELEANVQPVDAWYATAHRRPVRPADWKRLLSSARQRLIRALPRMTDFERVTLGTTYDEAFGAPSSTIHFRSGADPVDHSRESTVIAGGTKLSLVALCVMRRIYELLGRPSVPQLDQIARVLDTNQEPTRRLETLNSRSAIEVGDIVLARGYLGQVVDERVSQFAYRSVRIALLAERPLPHLDADWFRVRDVVRVFSREKLVAGVRAQLGDPEAVVDDAVLRKAALSAWELGLRDEVRSRTQPRRP